MKTCFPEEMTDIQQLFYTLVFKGKRNVSTIIGLLLTECCSLQEIRCIFRICRDPLKDDLYSKLRKHLYDFGRGKLSGRQLQALCEVQ